MDAYMDYGMILDIPAWVARSPAGAKATGISTYAEAVKATRINNDRRCIINMQPAAVAANRCLRG